MGYIIAFAGILLIASLIGFAMPGEQPRIVAAGLLRTAAITIVLGIVFSSVAA